MSNLLRAGGKTTSMVSGGRKKMHTTFDDGSEMVEEYDMRTNELVVRKRRAKSTLGREGEWTYEIGDPPAMAFNPDMSVMRESTQNPIFMRKDTERLFQWRVRNLPYPQEVYSVTIDQSDRRIVIRTSNKKYYKRIDIPELDLLKAPLEESQMSWKYSNNTLVVSYVKPHTVVEAEQQNKVGVQGAQAGDGDVAMKDGDVDCKQQ